MICVSMCCNKCVCVCWRTCVRTYKMSTLACRNVSHYGRRMFNGSSVCLCETFCSSCVMSYLYNWERNLIETIPLFNVGKRSGVLCNFFWPRLAHLRQEATIWLTCKMTNHSLFWFYVPFYLNPPPKKNIGNLPCKLKPVRTEFTRLRNYLPFMCALCIRLWAHVLV